MKVSATFGILLAAAASSVFGAEYKLRQIGALNTEKFRVYLENENGVPISPFHDVPLHPDPKNATVYNMVVEIPRWKNAKLEIDREEPFNPIYHDTNKNGLRYIANIFPFHGYPANYGSIPQTWEKPDVPHPDVHTKGGDNDPVDVLDIGQQVGYPGQVKQVKLLGGLLMIDDGETDWKLIAIDINDERAPHLNDINDIDDKLLADIKHWLTVYKMPQGKPENEFGYDGAYQNHKSIEKLMVETHGYWQMLINGTAKSEIETVNLSVEGSPNNVDRKSKEVKKVPKGNKKPVPDAPIDEKYQEWSFV
ncbi:inorganic pyrophosphatase [Zychaea mexicana]|uniref:inorganic pyrophosphatase n=1 Tax=Zychaea mexicana TaxID=64656 RepID=UPI0022FE6E09|nr:inorganic pyrophosphatase [Zychaea mexicana]KAI9494610.1 inorganic pyrophosphatase [Zychaea mexicana]